MEDGVTSLVQMFEDAEQATRDARKLSERDQDYYDGKQWTAAEAATLKKRNQPVVTYNRIQRKVDYLSGLEKQQRKDPKAFPRTPDDEDAADAATDAIRYVCDDTKWDEKRSLAWDDLLIKGTCALMVGHKDSRQGPDPEITHIPWDRFFYDPHSSRADFSDASFMGIVTWYDLKVAEKKWPEKKDVLNATLNSDKDTDTYDDKPKDKLWADYKRKRIRVIEGYYLEDGQWMRCVETKSGQLEETAPSPYMGEDGQPENPIKAVSLYVDRENNRYGTVRVMISPQDEINHRKSKAMHLQNMRQVRVSPVAMQDREEIRSELSKADGVFTGEKDDFEILPTADMARGNMEMYFDAKNEIDLLGANAALAGKNENDMSGRAILAQQQGGMVEVARMFDRLRSLSIEVYRSIWNRVRQLWQDERWVRITDNENNLRFVGLNQQVTLKKLAEEVMQGDEKAIAKASEIVGRDMLEAALDPNNPNHGKARTAIGMMIQTNGEQIVETRNAINELDVDIVLDEGMDTPTVQAEQFDALVKMLPGLGPIGQSPQVLKLLIEASQLRNKDKLLEMLEQGPSPEQVEAEQKQQQMAEAGAMAQIENVQSQTALNQAKAQQAMTPMQPEGVSPIEQARVMLEGEQTGIDAYRAETERMQAMQPEQPRNAA